LNLISGMKFGFFEMGFASKSLKVATVLALVGFTLTAGAQAAKPRRRESNQNRQNRIQRTIKETYTQRWEVGGGPGLVRFRSGEFKQRNNEISFWTSALYSVTPKLGLLAMGGGEFGSAKLGNGTPTSVNPQIQEFDFMAGPSYRIVSKEKFGVSAYGVGGVGYGRFSTGPKDFPATTVGLWPSGTAAAFSVGVNLDYHFYPNLSARITPNYLGTTFGNTIQNNKGLNIGLVYRFGHIRGY
jgi:opacity protein-like surface antigen